MPSYSLMGAGFRIVDPTLGLERAMAPHSSTLAWKIPWMEEPGGLQSMGSQRVGYDCATSLSLFTVVHWRRKWQPTPVFLPGESHGQTSLVGYSPWGRKESDTTERLHFHFQYIYVNLHFLIYPSPAFPFGSHRLVFYACKSL